MILTASATTGVFLWLRRLGGPGLVLLGLADNSFIPLTGGMDALAIVLSATHKDLWWYYALMATLGAVIGGYITYGIGKKGGKEALEDRVPHKRLQRIYERFETRGGFWAIFIPAMLPPPIPFVPFLVAAGALEYPTKKFFAAITSGRFIRYAVACYLGHIYGRQILRFMRHYYQPILWTFVVLFLLGCLSAYLLWRKQRRRRTGRSTSPSRSAA